MFDELIKNFKAFADYLAASPLKVLGTIVVISFLAGIARNSLAQFLGLTKRFVSTSTNSVRGRFRSRR